MVNDDVLYRFRLRLFSLALELGNVREACRICGGPPLHLLPLAGAGAPERARDAPAEGAPTAPDAQPDEPARRAAGGGLRARPPGSGSQAHQRHAGPGALGRHRAQPQRRVAGPPPPRPVAPHQPPVAGRGLCRTTGTRAPGAPLERHVEVDHPGELVGFDCFHVGRLSGTAGRVWQYTAIDLATSYVWAELAHHAAQPVGCRAPSALARRVAADLRAAWLAPRAGAHRQRERVPLPMLRRHDPRPGCDPDLHPAGASGHQRCGGAGPAHDPRGVLAAVLRAEPGAQAAAASCGTSRATCATTTRSVPTPAA